MATCIAGTGVDQGDHHGDEAEPQTLSARPLPRGGPGLSRIEVRADVLQALEDQQEREEEFEQAAGGEEQHAGPGVDVSDAERGARRAEQERCVAGGRRSVAVFMVSPDAR